MNGKKRLVFVVLIAALCLLLASCGQKAEEKAPIPDGVYSASVKADSSMFHVNEACDGKGVLTVAGGKMTVHVTLTSKKIVNLFVGTAEEAQKTGAVLLQPTLDTVTYDDGETEEVYGFDIPVPYLDREFDCALIGTKGKWYDHKVTVSDPQPKEDAAKTVEDGEYTCAVTLSGGSGRASVESPAKVVVREGRATAEIIWSSSNYAYMTVGETQYDPIGTEGNSTFEIPISFDADIPVSALTTAMTEPHLIEYTLHFDSATLQAR